MDEVDRAQVEIDYAMIGRLAVVRPRIEAQPNGACLNCGEPLAAPARWCDAGCRDDWARLLHSLRTDD